MAPKNTHTSLPGLPVEGVAVETPAAEAEAARIAAEEEEARAFGYPSMAIMKARMQPKSPEEEALLAAKYGAMDLGEKAFAFLTVSCHCHLGTLFSLLLVFCLLWISYFSQTHISLDLDFVFFTNTHFT